MRIRTGKGEMKSVFLVLVLLLQVLLTCPLRFQVNGQELRLSAVKINEEGPVRLAGKAAEGLKEKTTEKVARPIFHPEPGTFDRPVRVAITCLTPGASIYYTTDGTDPLTSASRRQARRAVLISFTSVVRAVAIKEGLEPSDIVEARFIIRVASPEAIPGPGAWRHLPEAVALSCATPQATIFYSLDGLSPSRQSLRYDGPIKLAKDRVNVIKAVAVKDDGSPDSFVATFIYEPNPDLVMLTDVLNSGANIQEIISRVIEAMALEEKAKLVWGAGSSPIGAAGRTYAIPRLGIISLDLADGPAGVRLNGHSATSWPNPLTLASTWNVKLVEQIGAAVGREAKFFGVDIMLSPGMNIHRDPLGGRVFEYYSEDPFLSGKIAAAYIRGVENQGVGATMKHYTANNFENNRANIDVVISERALREIYLPSWEIATKEASPWAVMTAYNKVNGEWCAENKYLLKALDEFGFSGLVMSDWGGYHNPVAYARGFDLNMPGGTGWESLFEAVEKKVISEEHLDQAVADILKVVIRSQSFKNQIYDKAEFVAKKQLTEELKAAHKVLATEAEAEGIVLLKNASNTLPLRDFLRVALIGSLSIPEYRTVGSAPAKGIIFEGGGSARVNVEPEDVISLAAALEKAGLAVLQKNSINAYFQEGLTETDAWYAVENSDAAVILIGRPGQEGFDNTSLDLNQAEKNMIKRVGDIYHRAGKRVIVLLNVAHPVVVDWDESADAIVYIGLPGTYGALAVAEILKGKVNPSGKLVDTWPKAYALAPTHGKMPKLDQSSTIYNEDIYVGYRYYDQHPEAVKYPFGYGLSYTTFSYKNMLLNKSTLNISNPDELLLVSVEVINTGNVAGKEVCQLYLRPLTSKVKRPAKELRGFAKTRLLEPGEAERLTFKLTSRDFAYWNEKIHSWEVEPGNYEIVVGGTSADQVLQTTGLKARLRVAK